MTTSPLLATIELAIDLAPTLQHLAAWWTEHQPALRRLTPQDRARAIHVKDRRKTILEQAAFHQKPPGTQAALF